MINSIKVCYDIIVRESAQLGVLDLHKEGQGQENKIHAVWGFKVGFFSAAKVDIGTFRFLNRSRRVDWCCAIVDCLHPYERTYVRPSATKCHRDKRLNV